MITAWRICKTRRAKSAFTGVGAAENPGRWNSLGTRMVYTAESKALAALEILAHVEEKAGLAKARFSATPVEIDELLIKPIPTTLPRDWRAIPPSKSTQLVGDAFVDEAKQPVMKLPSVVVGGEFIYIINPLHPAFPSLKIGRPEAFSFDRRVYRNPA